MTTRIKQSSLVTLASLTALAGLVLGRHENLSVWWLAVALVAAVLLWRSRWRPIGLIILALLIGAWRAGAVSRYDQTLVSQFGQKVTVAGTVADDPAINDHNQLSFNLAVDHMNGQPYHATIAIYVYRLPLKRGYRLAASGKLKPALGASQAEISFPSIQILSNHLNPLEWWRLRFFAAERATIPEPLASFALGLLIGARALIPKTLQGQLAAVGLSHLVAVSGYNLTILVNAAQRLFKHLGKFLVLALSLWLIGGFLAVAGASASIQRAALVSVLMLLAGYFGRQLKPALLISLAAAATAAANPHTLWSDLGWQLSFAAFFGILLLAPALSKRFGRNRAILALIFEAGSAYLLTLPIILHSFGTLAPAAPILNIIVLPLVPMAMPASFVAGLAGLAVPVLAGWFSWPAIILLRFIVGLVELAAKYQPQSVSVSATFVVIYYLMIGLVTWLLSRPHNPAPTWYNNTEEAAGDDVGTLKVA